MNATFKQAGHLIQLAIDQELSNEGFQILTNLGLLSDLFRATREGNLGAVNRDDFQKLLGLNSLVFRVTLGGPETTDQIVAALSFPANNWITQKNFPLTPHPEEEAEIEIIDPGCSFSEEEGLEFLKAAGLNRPTYEHALRFAEQYGMATTSDKKSFVVFLHEAWLGPDDYRRILYLFHRSANRRLSLCCSGNRLYDDCVLAGVRPRKPA